MGIFYSMRLYLILKYFDFHSRKETAYFNNRKDMQYMENSNDHNPLCYCL